jgi:hypothetical protein
MVIHFPDEKWALIRKLIREGHSGKHVAELAGCGTATVSKVKAEMGLTKRYQRNNVAKLAAPVLVDQPEFRPPPSPAAIRLAEFDPVIRRAIKGAMEEAEDGE